jgi:hypothetical protein
LRQRARRLLGRACWLFNKGPSFVKIAPVNEIEADARSHQEWIDRSKRVLTQLKLGSGDCFKLLHYSPGS